jgi:heavy metal translocating P-type ATPase
LVIKKEDSRNLRYTDSVRINSFSLNLGLIFLLALSLVINQQELLIFLAILATIPVLKSAVESVRNKEISVDLLASFALIVSMIEGQWNSAAFVNLMITSARIFEVYIETRAKKALESLTKLRPEKVKLVIGEKITEVGIDQVRQGDKILVEAGDRLAVDGEVISGNATIDQSSLTGESLPVNKEKGNKVFCSTLNISGSLVVKTEKVGKETSFQKIIDLVEKANQAKEGVNSVVAKFTTGYIVLTAITCGVIWILTKNITLLLSLLLVTCADDIAVAVPLVYWGAIAMAAKKGVIVKSGLSLEILKKVNVLIVDKTGTLTKGKIEVQHITVFDKIKENGAIKLAASIAGISSHPIAKSIVILAEEKQIDFELIKNFEEIPGEGIEAADSKNKYFLGGIKAIVKRKIKLTKKETEEYKKMENEGHNLLFLFKNEKLLALFGLADQLKPGISKSVAELKANGIKKIMMLTGDNQVVAKNIAQKTGLDEYKADLMPEEKLNYVDNEINNGKIVAYVGDGVNDAAGLARANVGIAMGAIGTDAAIEAADIALMNDNFEKINDMVNLSRKLGKIVVGNFSIWATVNMIGLILVFGFKISPETAAAYNFVTDFIPLLNSVRIFRK